VNGVARTLPEGAAAVTRLSGSPRRTPSAPCIGDDGAVNPADGKRAETRRRTRRAIREAALTLFHERGFDDVTTVEVARAAGVAPATLFNYYDTKEDLVFGQVRQLERELVAVVEACAPQQSILAALRGHVLYELTAGRHETDPAAVAPFHRMVAASARLQAREHEMLDRRESLLADAIARRMGPAADRLQARVGARMYVAAEQLVANELRDRLTRVDPGTALREITSFIDDVFTILGAGLGELPAGS